LHWESDLNDKNVPLLRGNVTFDPVRAIQVPVLIDRLSRR